MSVFQQTATAGKSGDYTPPSEANHSGVLVAIIDLGTHTETYQDGKKSDVHKIFFVFELDEENESGKRHVLGKEVTLTTSPKSTLRKIMEGLRGKAYVEGEAIDVAKALGRAGLINVKQKKSNRTGNPYAIIESVAPLPKGMAPLKPSHELTIWEIGCGKPFPKHAWLPESFLNQTHTPLEKIMEASHEVTSKKATPAAPAQTNGTAPAAVQTPQQEEPIPF
jgi:hypothetical protein